MTKPNLWAEAFRSYWSDPRNVLGPPGALVRRLIKLLWLALAVYVLFWVAGPSQVKSWQLWMQDDALARDIAWAFTFASALCFAIVGFAAAATKPFRVPLFLPKFEGSWRNLKVRTVHVNLPNVSVTLGSILAASLFFIALLGQWNYYLHDGMSTGGTSVAALSGSTDRVGEAQASLSAFEARTAEADAAVTAAIAATSAGSPTGRSRLVTAQAEAARNAATERTRLTTELRDARAATVTAHGEFTDPRPVDGQVAAATGADRGLVASLLDLLRSGVVEALLVMGAALGLVVAPSEIGVPKAKPEEDKPAEVVAETEPAPEAEPVPPPKRRFVLPLATEQDYAEAVAVGPVAAPVAEPTPPATDDAPPAEPLSDDPSDPVPPVAETLADEPVDPLLADILENAA